MQEETYAVYWTDEPDGRRYAGRIALHDDHAVLSGSGANGRRSFYRLFFDELVSARYERGRLSLRRRSAPTIHVGSVDKPGALKELADRVQAALAL